MNTVARRVCEENWSHDEMINTRCQDGIIQQWCEWTLLWAMLQFPFDAITSAIYNLNLWLYIFSSSTKKLHSGIFSTYLYEHVCSLSLSHTHTHTHTNTQCQIDWQRAPGRVCKLSQQLYFSMTQPVRHRALSLLWALPSTLARCLESLPHLSITSSQLTRIRLNSL